MSRFPSISQQKNRFFCDLIGFMGCEILSPNVITRKTTLRRLSKLYSTWRETDILVHNSTIHETNAETHKKTISPSIYPWVIKVHQKYQRKKNHISLHQIGYVFTKKSPKNHPIMNMSWVMLMCFVVNVVMFIGKVHSINAKCCFFSPENSIHFQPRLMSEIT